MKIFCNNISIGWLVRVYSIIYRIMIVCWNCWSPVEIEFYWRVDLIYLISCVIVLWCVCWRLGLKTD